MASRRTHLRGLSGRAGWTVADQAVSSISNAGLSLLVARSVDAPSFGAFTVSFVVFTTVVGLARAWIVDPLVIAYSGETAQGEFTRAVERCTGASLVAGVASGVLCVAGAAVVGGGTVSAALLALAVSLPGLLLQDAWRQALFSARRPRAATFNDLVWAVVQFGGSALLIALGRDGVATLLLVWGGGATVAAGLGVLQLRALPRPGRARQWLAEQRHLGSRLGLGFLVNTGAVNAAVFVVGAVAGLAAAGSLRAAQTLVGPLQALFAATSSLALPVLAGRAADGQRTGVGPAVAVSAVLGTVSAAWLAVLLLLPTAVGEELLGASWAGARDVLLGIGLVTLIVAVATGPGLLLKAWGEASLLLNTIVVQAPFILLLAGGGALLTGAPGAAAGLAAAHLVGFSLMMRHAARAVHQRQAATAPQPGA